MKAILVSAIAILILVVIGFIVRGLLKIKEYKASFDYVMKYHANKKDYVPIDFKYFADFYFVSPESYTLNDDFVTYRHATKSYFDYLSNKERFCYERTYLYFPSFTDFVKYRSFVKKINKRNDEKKMEEISLAQSIATVEYLRKVQKDIDRLREGKD